MLSKVALRRTTRIFTAAKRGTPFKSFSTNQIDAASKNELQKLKDKKQLARM